MPPALPEISARPISARAFAPFGELIEVTGQSPIVINDGLCNRYSDLGIFNIEDGKTGISLFQSEMRQLPYVCGLLERHPLGSQCFIPMSDATYLIVVAKDNNGKPGPLKAFIATNHHAVNIAKNTWHGVLTPLSGSGLFAVIDRIGAGANLEEYPLKTPVTVRA